MLLSALLFCRYHPNAEPQYKILKTPLSKKLSQDVQVFIHNFHNIPAFTANYTMTLFHQTTSWGEHVHAHATWHQNYASVREL